MSPAGVAPLHGKAALVTGASRGIGRAIALRLARDGAMVAVHHGRSADAARAVLGEIEAGGGRGFLVAADLASADALPALADAVAHGFAAAGHDGVDIIVHNAGINGEGSIETIDRETYDAIFAVNVAAPFFLTQRLLPGVAQGGRIVLVSSMVAAGAHPERIVYAMSKATVNHLVRCLAAGLGPRGITVNAVAPGATRTDLLGGYADTPEGARQLGALAALGRIGEPDDIAGVVAFLCGPDGGWVTGQVLQASGGMAL